MDDNSGVNDSDIEHTGSDVYLQYRCGCRWRPGDNPRTGEDATLEVLCFRHEVLAINEMETSKRK